MPYTFSTGTDEEAASASQVALVPKIFQHVGGVAIAAQVAVSERIVVEPFRWKQLMGKADVQHVVGDDCEQGDRLGGHREIARIPADSGWA